MVDEDNFEEPIRDLERRIEALSGVGADTGTERQLQELQGQLESLRTRIFSALTPWQKTLVARNARRPYTLDYVSHLVEDFREIHGDRKYADDAAIVALHDRCPQLQHLRLIPGQGHGFTAGAVAAIRRCLLSQVATAALQF